MAATADKWAGRFLVLDGPDGAGKSTQLARLADWLGEAGLEVVTTRDPGGTAIGDRVRAILLDPAADEMSVPCETMLYMASRAQLVAEVVRPALARGAVVLCDRFVSSTLAYQTAGGADPAAIRTVAAVAIGQTWPDLTVILDLDPAAGLDRVQRGLDRMEAKGLPFHQRVREAFLTQARQDPRRFAVIDAAAEADTVFARLRATLDTWPL